MRNSDLLPRKDPASATVGSGLRVEKERRLGRLLALGIFFGLGLALIASSIDSPQDRFFVGERLQTFVTIFLGIFIEAVPFLLAGSLVSGLIATYVDERKLERWIPRQPVLAALVGSGLGLVFPVCECGVVPVTRRLYAKGLPLSVGIAFLLSAPVINPVVIASTYAAFGWSPLLWGRIGLSILIAFGVGLLFQLAQPGEILPPQQPDGHDDHHVHCHPSSPAVKRWQVLTTAGDDFTDMARYLIAGSLLAAGMQTLVPQTALIAIGQGPIVSVFAMMLLAFVLSVCSTVDAFIALAYSNTFTAGALLGFLVFGPMVDIKSSLMFLGVFRRRIVLYLILLPFALTAVAAVLWNLTIGGA